jgi:hypothetical protein
MRGVSGVPWDAFAQISAAPTIASRISSTLSGAAEALKQGRAEMGA